MPSYRVGRCNRNKIQPYYAIVRQSRTMGGETKTGRWFWTARRYADNSTAFRGPGNGFPSKREALDDLKKVLWSFDRMTFDVREND